MVGKGTICWIRGFTSKYYPIFTTRRRVVQPRRITTVKSPPGVARKPRYVFSRRWPKYKQMSQEKDVKKFL